MKQEKVLTISKQIWLLSGIFAILLTVVGMMGLLTAIKLGDRMNRITHVYMKVSNNLILLDMFHDGLAAKVFKGLWFSGQGKGEEVNAVKAETAEMIGKVREVSEEFQKLDLDKEAREKIHTALAPYEDYTKMTNEIIELAGKPNGVQQAVAKLGDFEKSFEALESSLEALGESLESDAAAFLKEAEEVSDVAKKMEVAVLIVGNLIGLFIAWYFVRGIFSRTSKIVESLATGSVRLNDYAQSISDSASTLAESTTELSSAIEETASSMEEMGSMIAQTTANAGQTYHQADGSLQDASAGKNVVNKMVHSMRDIAESTERLSSIAKVIEDIKNKTKIINDIAFETRLLAFNASIEAARAGAHGRGFAVVAEEVGKLANVSGKAAEEVRSLLEQSVSQVGNIIETTNKKIEEGEKTTKECEHAFVKMHESITLITQGIQRINTAAKEQESGVKQTNKAIGEMEKVTQANSRSAESLSSHADSLSGSSKDLLTNANDMQLLVFGQVDSSRKFSADRGDRHKGHAEDSHRSRVVHINEAKVRKNDEHKAAAEEGHSQENQDKGDKTSQDKEVDRNDSRWHAA